MSVSKSDSENETDIIKAEKLKLLRQKWNDKTKKHYQKRKEAGLLPKKEREDAIEKLTNEQLNSIKSLTINKIGRPKKVNKMTEEQIVEKFEELKQMARDNGFTLVF